MGASNNDDRRSSNRKTTEIKAIVQVKSSDGSSWKEITKLTTVSRSGASFLLARDCTVGRLITLVVPMPTDLRAYDHDEKLYAILAIVQHSTVVPAVDSDTYHIGVGFIGNRIPASYTVNPEQNYRLTGASRDGLWTVTEVEKRFITRREPRFPYAADVSLSLLKKSEKTVQRETTVTRDISCSGVSVESDLDADIGDRIKVACKAVDFYSMATVRNHLQRSDGKHTIHLEFDDSKFPIDKITAERRHDEPHQKGFQALLTNDEYTEVEVEVETEHVLV